MCEANDAGCAGAGALPVKEGSYLTWVRAKAGCRWGARLTAVLGEQAGQRWPREAIRNKSRGMLESGSLLGGQVRGLVVGCERAASQAEVWAVPCFCFDVGRITPVQRDFNPDVHVKLRF